MSSSFKIIFVHGYTSSSPKDWYPKISRLLDKNRIEYVIPDLPGERNPKAEEWLRVIHTAVLDIHKTLIFVGHSLGTRAILLYLEKYQTPVEKVFLIAPFANRTKNTLQSNVDAFPDFFTRSVDLGKIKPLVGKFIVIHSRDDASIDYQQGVEIALDLQAQLILYDNYGHFNKPKYAKIILENLKSKLMLLHKGQMSVTL